MYASRSQGVFEFPNFSYPDRENIDSFLSLTYFGVKYFDWRGWDIVLERVRFNPAT